jgi:CO/xanthine dehydrogenase FAD-binding subunit
MNMRLARPAAVVDINMLPGLDRISVDGGTVSVGALVRQRTAERSRLVQEQLPLLAEALPWVGHATIRNRGTVGGSMCHADPAAELPAAAVALGAEMLIESKQGARTVPAADFFIGPLTSAVKPDELLVGVRWPGQKTHTASAWVELAMRHGDYALVGVAATVAVDLDGTCLLAELTCAGVGYRPIRLTAATEGLVGHPFTAARIAEAGKATAASVDPSSDSLASAAYKRRVVGVMAERALATAHNRAQTGPR